MAILLLSLSGSKVVSFDSCFFPLHSVTHHFYENFSAAGHDHNQHQNWIPEEAGVFIGREL